MSEWCYGMCVVCNFIDVHKTSKCGCPCAKLHKTHSAQQNYVQISCTKLHLNETICVWKIWTGIHLYPCVKYGFRCTSIYEHHDQPNFCVCLYQILSKLGGKYHVYPSVKYDCHWDDVHKTYPCSRTICTVFHGSLTYHSVADIGHGRNATVSM
jgi:hypothetical protein